MQLRKTSCLLALGNLLLLFSCKHISESYLNHSSKIIKATDVHPAEVFEDTKGSTLELNSFKDKKIVAGIINLANYVDSSISFNMLRPGKVRIYAVGELIPQLAVVDRKYFLGNPQIEIFFDTQNYKSVFRKEATKKKQYIFTLLEGYTGGVNTNNQGIKFNATLDSVNNVSISSIAIPWKNLNIKPMRGQKTGFDIAFAYNYHGICQNKKTAWSNHRDIMVSTTRFYGNLILDTGITHNQAQGKLYSVYRQTIISGSTASLPSVKVENVIAGDLRKSKDFSIVRSAWDKKNLYFYIEGHQSLNYYRQKYITKEKRKTLKTFSDYGWIEDSKGRTIWKMDVMVSKHAGGANKNQYIDTTILLNAGRYKLNYHTDESHSFNNWDDTAPTSPFYGILIYK